MPDRRYVHPAFQFDARGQIRPAVAELLKVLPVDDDPGGWRRAFWLYSPHSYLDGRAPAEEFENDAQQVIEVAKHEFGQDTNLFW